MADVQRGERIRARREELHLSQPAVVELMENAAWQLPRDHDLHPANAEKAPIGLRGYQTYEQGGGIVWEKAKLLAGVLQMDVETMMSGPREQETPDPLAGRDDLAETVERAVEAALSGVLGKIEKQLAEQTETLNEMRAALQKERQARTQADEATRRLLAVVDQYRPALRGETQPQDATPGRPATSG